MRQRCSMTSSSLASCISSPPAPSFRRFPRAIFGSFPPLEGAILAARRRNVDEYYWLLSPRAGPKMPAQEDPMATQAIEEPGAGAWATTRRFMLHEFRHVLPPTIYFFLGFNLILFTKRMILAEHLIQFGGFLVATTAALIVGKTVLVADKLPFLRRFD